MKRFWAMILTILLCAGMLPAALAEHTTAVLEQTRMYDSAFDDKVRLLIPQGAEVELVEIGQERVLVRYGAFCGWIERAMIEEEAIEAFAVPTPAATKEPMVMVTPSPVAEEEKTESESTQTPEEKTLTTDAPVQSDAEETAAPETENVSTEEPAEEKPEEAQVQKEAAVEPVATMKPLKMNSSGDAVENLQQNLTELGYSVGRIDGYYGKKTRTAVIKLQRYYGLQADGIVGEETLALIEALLGPDADQVEPAPLPFVRVLRKGRRGEEVEKLQKVLCELAYLKEEQVSGVYDSETVAAVKTFQKQAGLEVDGVAGEKTIFVLSSTVRAQRMVSEAGN